MWNVKLQQSNGTLWCFHKLVLELIWKYLMHSITKLNCVITHQGFNIYLRTWSARCHWQGTHVKVTVVLMLYQHHTILWNIFNNIFVKYFHSSQLTIKQFLLQFMIYILSKTSKSKLHLSSNLLEMKNILRTSEPSTVACKRRFQRPLPMLSSG